MATTTKTRRFSRSRVRHELGFALGAVYRVRMNTNVDQFTEWQRETLRRIESDISKLRDSMTVGKGRADGRRG